jgi:hypothetical protein
MSLGSSRPRNWGREAQASALALTILRGRVAYQIRQEGRGACRRPVLYLAPSHDGVTLPFTDSVADLVHVTRGRWEAHHRVDGRTLARGVSITDVVRATIEAIAR